MFKLMRLNLFMIVFWTIMSLFSIAPAQGTAADEPLAAKDLSFLLGKWETKLMVHRTELTPEGGAGKGTAEYHLFGKAIEGSRSGESTFGHYEDREYIVPHGGTVPYLIFTISSTGTSTQRTLSRYADVWTVEYDGQFKDKDFVIRGKYKIVSDKELRFMSEIDVGKAGFKPFIELTLKRISN